MANETESLEEMLALQEKIGKLVECGWSDDPDDHYALRLMWYAGRDYTASAAAARISELETENARLLHLIGSFVRWHDNGQTGKPGFPRTYGDLDVWQAEWDRRYAVLQALAAAVPVAPEREVSGERGREG